jgi:hypothetical protein
MGVMLCEVEVDVEHIVIEYEGGSITLRYKEYHQTLKLFKHIPDYGEDVVVISSSAWFEFEHTLKRGECCYYVMLCNGGFNKIEKPTRACEYGDEAVVIKIVNNLRLSIL